LEIILARLSDAQPCRTKDEAYALLTEIITRVDDELSGAANAPHLWESDGRLYPPQEDMAKRSEKWVGAVEYRNVRHLTVFSENGAIKIFEMPQRICIFSKPDAEGNFLA